MQFGVKGIGAAVVVYAIFENIRAIVQAFGTENNLLIVINILIINTLCKKYRNGVEGLTEP